MSDKINYKVSINTIELNQGKGLSTITSFSDKPIIEKEEFRNLLGTYTPLSHKVIDVYEIAGKVYNREIRDKILEWIKTDSTNPLTKLNCIIKENNIVYKQGNCSVSGSINIDSPVNRYTYNLVLDFREYN